AVAAPLGGDQDPVVVGNRRHGIGGIGGRGRQRAFRAVRHRERVHVEYARLVGGDQELEVVRRPGVPPGQPVAGRGIEGGGRVAARGLARRLRGRPGRRFWFTVPAAAGREKGRDNERQPANGHETTPHSRTRA